MSSSDHEWRIWDAQELHERVPYSRVQVWRLEKAGQFPRRIKLGPNRVGWLQSEVERWLKERLASRRPEPVVRVEVDAE